MTKEQVTDEINTQQANGPRRLSVAEYEGKLYFVDERLGEMRRVEDPFERIPLGTVKGARYVDVEELPAPRVHQE